MFEEKEGAEKCFWSDSSSFQVLEKSINVNAVFSRSNETFDLLWIFVL